jgi:hypothetical protein
MMDESKKGEGQGHVNANNPRQDRLKQALRENLKRRKSQARARGDPTAAPSGAGGTSPPRGGEKKPGE